MFMLRVATDQFLLCCTSWPFATYVSLKHRCRACHSGAVKLLSKRATLGYDDSSDLAMHGMPCPITCTSRWTIITVLEQGLQLHHCNWQWDISKPCTCWLRQRKENRNLDHNIWCIHMHRPHISMHRGLWEFPITYTWCTKHVMVHHVEADNRMENRWAQCFDY